MIEFKGEMIGKAKKFILGRHSKVQKIAFIGTAVVLLPVIIVLSILIEFPLGMLLYIPLAMIVGFAFIPPSKSDQQTFVPKRLFIDTEEGTIVSQAEKRESFHMIEAVDEVVDYGEWYHFVFRFEDRDPYFVCQKSLLTEGTLEEFEQLFEGKIERRY
ncbi:MAG: hypothetical protein IKC87_04235 [Clostridia bacterium]|nr:hypothetical protein [Clostridia bacterium]